MINSEQMRFSKSLSLTMAMLATQFVVHVVAVYGVDRMRRSHRKRMASTFNHYVKTYPARSLDRE